MMRERKTPSRVLATAITAGIGAAIGAGFTATAKADIQIGQDWNPVANSNGYTYFDGFTDYADGTGNTQLQQVTRNGNNWLQYSNANGQYWGQLVGQNWANPNVVPANVNANPRLEFDVDLSQYTWGRLMLRTDYNNDNGLGGQESGTKTTDFSHLVAKNKGTIASTPNPFIEHISVDLSSFGLRNTAAAWSELQVFMQPNFWGYWDADTSTFISQPYAAQTFFIDNMRLTSDPVKVNASWNIDTDGSWPTGLNSSGTATWAGGTPNGAGHTANFMAVTNYDSEQNTINAHTVTVDSPVTIGVMNFNNSNGYTIAGPSTITVQDAVGVPAAINTALGNHTISAPLALASDTTVTVQNAGNTLTLSNLQSSSVALTKAGPGTLAVNNVRAGALNVNAGTAKVLSDGTTNGTSKVGALSLASGASLDLTNNALVVNYDGSSPIGAMQASAAAAFNSGNWNGAGLTSSTAASNASSAHKTGIGLAEASDLGTTSFRGQTVDSTSVLARYTYLGDGNLDGVVNTTDFNLLASNFGGSGKRWFNGDFNYDGSVNTTDFNLLASNFGQSVPADAGGSALGALVPEPTSLTLLGSAAVIAMTGRRRRAQARAASRA